MEAPQRTIKISTTIIVKDPLVLRSWACRFINSKWACGDAAGGGMIFLRTSMFVKSETIQHLLFREVDMSTTQESGDSPNSVVVKCRVNSSLNLSHLSD